MLSRGLQAADSFSSQPIASEDSLSWTPALSVASEDDTLPSFEEQLEEVVSFHHEFHSLGNHLSEAKRSHEERMAKTKERIQMGKESIWRLIDGIEIAKDTLRAYGVDFSQPSPDSSVVEKRAREPQATFEGTTPRSKTTLSGSKRKQCEDIQNSDDPENKIDAEVDSYSSGNPTNSKKTRLNMQVDEAIAALEAYLDETQYQENALDAELRILLQTSIPLREELQRLETLAAENGNNIIMGVLPGDVPGMTDYATIAEPSVCYNFPTKEEIQCPGSEKAAAPHEVTSGGGAAAAVAAASLAATFAEIAEGDTPGTDCDSMEGADQNTLLWSGMWSSVPGSNAATLAAAFDDCSDRESFA